MLPIVKFKPQTIDALANVISGGSSGPSENTVGLYRSGREIAAFMRGCGVDFTLGAGSRLPTLQDALLKLNDLGETEKLKTIIENAASPADFVERPELINAVLDHLNARLRLDDLELQHQNGRVRLVQAGTSARVITELGKATQTYDFDTVSREIERALRNAEEDPEDAITAACSIVEGICRSVLVELKVDLPAKRDVKSLFRAVREPLGLSPDRSDLPDEAIDDIRGILGGLSGVVDGIGSLRTHVGDAHGRERGFRRVDARIARLAVHSASSVSLFIIETWQRKYPMKPLIASDAT